MNTQQGVRVLIAEDDYLVSEMIKGLLEEAGYTVVGTATNGREAIETTQFTQPDVVLMDIRMPDMDGIAATQHIYDQHPTPVVVLSAYETPELVKRASAAGVGAYLIKPPNVREIERAITVAMARFDDLLELRRLNAELEARNTDLDNFAQTVAHDLKGPLAPLVGFAETLAMDYTTTMDSEGLFYLQKIVDIGRKMGNVVDELLLLAELRAEDTPVEPLDMAAIVTEAQQRLAHLIREQQAEIILLEPWPTALGYGPWVEEVWVNYLSNGLKYGGKPEEFIAPRLELGARAQPDGTVRFWVSDNGPGITPEKQAELFVPRTQFQVRAKGHGLGLSIVQNIVAKLSGQVGVESQVGAGSTFWFTLPGTKAP